MLYFADTTNSGTRTTISFYVAARQLLDINDRSLLWPELD